MICNILGWPCLSLTKSSAALELGCVSFSFCIASLRRCRRRLPALQGPRRALGSEPGALRVRDATHCALRFSTTTRHVQRDDRRCVRDKQMSHKTKQNPTKNARTPDADSRSSCDRSQALSRISTLNAFMLIVNCCDQPVARPAFMRIKAPSATNEPHQQRTNALVTGTCTVVCRRASPPVPSSSSVVHQRNATKDAVANKIRTWFSCTGYCTTAAIKYHNNDSDFISELNSES